LGYGSFWTVAPQVEHPRSPHSEHPRLNAERFRFAPQSEGGRPSTCEDSEGAIDAAKAESPNSGTALSPVAAWDMGEGFQGRC